MSLYWGLKASVNCEQWNQFKEGYSYFVVIKERWFAFGIIAGGDLYTKLLEESIQMTALEKMSWTVPELRSKFARLALAEK